MQPNTYKMLRISQKKAPSSSTWWIQFDRCFYTKLTREILHRARALFPIESPTVLSWTFHSFCIQTFTELNSNMLTSITEERKSFEGYETTFSSYQDFLKSQARQKIGTNPRLENENCDCLHSDVACSIVFSCFVRWVMLYVMLFIIRSTSHKLCAFNLKDVSVLLLLVKLNFSVPSLWTRVAFH